MSELYRDLDSGNKTGILLADSAYAGEKFVLKPIIKDNPSPQGNIYNKIFTPLFVVCLWFCGLHLWSTKYVRIFEQKRTKTPSQLCVHQIFGIQRYAQFLVWLWNRANKMYVNSNYYRDCVHKCCMPWTSWYRKRQWKPQKTISWTAFGVLIAPNVCIAAGYPDYDDILHPSPMDFDPCIDGSCFQEYVVNKCFWSYIKMY